MGVRLWGSEVGEEGQRVGLQGQTETSQSSYHPVFTKTLKLSEGMSLAQEAAEPGMKPDSG